MFDPACLDLARHFLCDAEGREPDETQLAELAQALQDTAEDYLAGDDKKPRVFKKVADSWVRVDVSLDELWGITAEMRGGEPKP